MPSSTASARTGWTSESISALWAMRCVSRSRIPVRSTVLRAHAGAVPELVWRTCAGAWPCTIPVAPSSRSPIAAPARTRWWRRWCWRAIRAGPDRRRRASGAPGDAAPSGRAPQRRDRRRGREPRRGDGGHRADRAAARLPGHRAGRRRRRFRSSCRAGATADRRLRHRLRRTCGRGLCGERGGLPAEAGRARASCRIARAERQLERGPPASGVIALRTPKQTVLAQPAEIAALRADGDFTHVFIADQPAVMIWRTLGHFEVLLPSPPFLRLGRSLIINRDRLRKVETPSRAGGQITLEGMSEPLILGRTAAAR